MSFLNQKAAVDAFTHEVREFKEAVPVKLYKPFRDGIASFALRNIIKSTPVLTGHAQGNWQLGLNGSNSSEIDNNDVSGEGTILAGIAVIAGSRPFDNIHIFNNAPYILDLENGRSQQSPVGMITPTAAALAVFL